MTSEIFERGDELGPYKTIHVFNPQYDVHGILVIDNVAIGPAIGGLRMARDVTFAECARLARAMTFKNAAAGLRHGGGKSVLIADPDAPLDRKEAMIRAFADALRNEDQYIFGPDMGTNEQCMAWILDEIGRSVGLPEAMGGIPLDELGATGYGIAAAAEVAQPYSGVDLAGATVAIQGFGSVGIHAARFLAEKGTKLIAAADSRGTLYDPDGIDIDALVACKQVGKSVAELGKGEAMGVDDIVGIKADIWVPAARPDVIRADNVEKVDTRLIIQGANIPVTEEAEAILHTRGVLVIPDFIANAGGVICAAMEFEGMSKAIAFDTIREKVANNTKIVLENAKQQRIPPRQAAMDLARHRIQSAMRDRRWSLY